MEQTDQRRDFFISYTGTDQTWAEWIAWQLEEAGYTTLLQAWDFTNGARFVGEMHRATQISERTIAVLSNSYAQSSYAAAEWQEAWRTDPNGSMRKLLVFRIEECERPGLLSQVVSVDLFGIDSKTARARLLQSVRQGRGKPTLPPGFPAEEPPTNEPPFPGYLVKGHISDAMAAGGPLTPDNPFAVAFGFWSAILHDDYSLLDNVISPESRDRWNLAELREKTNTSGMTTGVMKPCYDVAYVRMMKDVGAEEGPLKVAGGLLPTDVRVISLVLRPELGGWRVHGFGVPIAPDDLPRTWKDG